jgi:hypothetical protein
MLKEMFKVPGFFHPRYVGIYVIVLLATIHVRVLHDTLNHSTPKSFRGKYCNRNYLDGERRVRALVKKTTQKHGENCGKSITSMFNRFSNPSETYMYLFFTLGEPEIPWLTQVGTKS